MTRTPRLTVAGSANMDMVVRVERIPIPGETTLGGAFTTVPGGKGANQAVAAARLGGHVHFLARVGQDAFGDALVAALAEAGVTTAAVGRDETEPTGVALIGVDAHGQNAIIVAPGANYRLSPQDVDAAKEIIASSDFLVLQLEISLETVLHAVQLAKQVGTRVILNPAPVRHTNPLPDALLHQIDLLVPNEHEAVALLGFAFVEGHDLGDVARQLQAKTGGTVVVTLGGEGSLVATADGVEAVPALPVTPVDTTAAGDCFTGGLAVALAEGQSLMDAVQFASRAAAVSVTRRGAQPSLPIRADVDAIATKDLTGNGVLPRE